jgi:hypothetical protein
MSLASWVQFPTFTTNFPKKDVRQLGPIPTLMSNFPKKDVLSQLRPVSYLHVKFPEERCP